MTPSPNEGPPHKRARFFAPSFKLEGSIGPVAEPPAEIDTPSSIGLDIAEGRTDTPQTGGGDTSSSSWNLDLIKGICGDSISENSIEYLKTISGSKTEQAINLFYDGALSRMPQMSTADEARRKPDSTAKTVQTVKKPGTSATRGLKSKISSLTIQPAAKQRESRRFLGAFGAAGWATCSGLEVDSGSQVLICRDAVRHLVTTKGTKGRPRNLLNYKPDITIKFTTTDGREIGKIESETAQWITPLLDQGICVFDAACVYSPGRIRSGDTLFLQLKCYFRMSAFERAHIAQLEESNLPHFFEAKESTAEKELRLRQMSIMRLFEEIGIYPARVDEKRQEKAKRQELIKSLSHKSEPSPASTPQPAKSTDETEPETAEGEELGQEQLDALYKKAQSFDFDTPEYTPADTFNLNLRKYQRQALHWMISKERNTSHEHKKEAMHPLWEEYHWPTFDPIDEKELPAEELKSFYVNPYSGEISLDFPKQEHHCRGGILADEMGLGKTIEMLSLIHSNKAEQPAAATGSSKSVVDLAMLSRPRSAVVRAPRTTLVIAPMSLLSQWQGEAEKASKEGTLKVMVYYGPEKNVDLQGLCREENWANAPDVIITSYGVILSEFTQLGPAASEAALKSHTGLFSIEYFRTILDEAHYIKNRASKTAKACYNLKATHRWALTGTPIVNRLEDLFSLVKFLQIEPWSNFSYWKTFITIPFESKNFLKALDVVQSVMEPLVLRRTKDMKTPDGEALVALPARHMEVLPIEFSKSEQEIYDLIYLRLKRTLDETIQAGTVLKSYTAIFSQILRLRQSCCHPILTRKDTVVADEVEEGLLKDACTGMTDDMDLESLLSRFSETLDEDASRFGTHALKQIQDAARLECPLCFADPMEEQTVTDCWHSACKGCMLEYVEYQKKHEKDLTCFSCRKKIQERDLFQVIRHDERNVPLPSAGSAVPSPTPTDGGKGKEEAGKISLRRLSSFSSAKVITLLDRLNEIRRRSNSEGAAAVGSKVVVFSQFTSFLGLIEEALTRDGISFLRFDGTMSQPQRAAVLADFRSREERPNSMVVLLLSLRAGGVGLNLTCARHVFMMDPWWSYAVEAQAIDRVHRMGQEHDVHVSRFIVKGSIEEKMLRIQERKKFLASSIGMMGDNEKKLQRIEDIKELLA